MSNKTVSELQHEQPWTVPYAKGLNRAMHDGLMPHALGAHCALHVAKTAGKLATVFEALDHPGDETGWASDIPTDAQLAMIKSMAADLFTAAMRFANLYGFDLETELLRRQVEKNG
jgi:hypothetical protein